nr:ribonuclease H-like domain-containing protein [Tanacetum cinerariifolium]
MEQYLTNTDYGLWQVIMNGDEPIQTTRDENGVETEKFLRALPSSWNNIALIMRNKEGIDELDIDDPYNNLKVFEANIKAGHSSTGKASSSSYTDDLMFSFFASQLNSPQLDDEDLEQIDPDDLEEMDLKYGLGYDLSYIVQEEPTKFALMAYTSGSDIELGLKSVEAQLIVHQKNEVSYEEKIAVLEFKVKDKGNAITRLTNQLDQTLKEKEDLKAKLEQFEISSKNLNKLINSQLSAKDKTGLGYGDQLSESDSEVLPSVFDSRLSDGDDSPTNRPTTNKASTSISKGESSVIKTSNISVEMPKVDSVRTSGVIIKDWVSDDEDTLVDTQGFKGTVNTVRINGVNTAGQTSVSTVKGNGVTVVKTSAGCVWRPKITDLNNISKDSSGSWILKIGNPQQALKYKRMFDSGCSRHMTGNKALLTDYQDIDGGFVAFGGSTKGDKITGIGKIRTNKIDFEEVFFVKELKFNLFSVSQLCDKENSVLFTESECLVLSPDFKLIVESQVLLRAPRQNNMYSFDLKNVVSSKDLTCLFAKAIIYESNLWHRRLGHVNFKTMNKLVKGNLVQGLPSKTFENDHTCVACQKGKQHKASWNQANKNIGHQEVNGDTGLKKNVDVRHTEQEKVSTQQYIMFPLWSSISSCYKSSDDKAEDNTADDATGKEKVQEPISEYDQALKNFLERMMNQEKEAKEKSNYVRKEFQAQCNSQLLQEKVTRSNSTNSITTVSTPVNTASTSRTFFPLHDPLMPELEDTAKTQTTGIFGNTYDEDDLETNNHSYANESVCAEANFNNMEPSTVVSPIPITRVHSNHPKAQIIGDPMSAVQTRDVKSAFLYGTIEEEMLDYGYNFMQTKIHVDNESAICVIKNLVYHSKIKHIEIRHHFIIDSYEKRQIKMVKIHIDNNVADLLTKAFDVSRFNFLVASIGQMATGKELSNLLMAGSLPKTTLPTKLFLLLLFNSSANFWQWQQPSLAMGTYTASGNSILAVGMPCAFYSQQSSPKLDAPSALKFSRIK